MIFMRIGLGIDVHRLVEGRKLILGGVEVEWNKGLLGHSDADVLVHAICDALLGAAALGDIGSHFPDTDESYKDISSLVLLRRVNELIGDLGYSINNIDSTIICQKPKLASYMKNMRENVASTLNTAMSNISIKATTTENLGYVGREEGVAVHAIASIVHID